MTKRGMALLLLFASCGTPAPAESGADPVAAWVNGRPITEPELEFAQRRGGPSGEALDREGALAQLVQLELEAQAAEAEGLDEDPVFQFTAQKIRTEASSAHRQSLAKHYRMAQLERVPDVPESEARAWFDANQEQVRVEFEVVRVMARSLPAAEKAATALESGAPWHEIRSKFGIEAKEPPTIGFDRLAPGWWEALSVLAPGEVSEPVHVIGDRYVVFRLVERREVEAPTFERTQRKIVALLQAKWLEEHRAQSREARRQAATIEIVE